MMMLDCHHSTSATFTSITYELHPHLFFPYILTIKYTNSILATLYGLHSTIDNQPISCVLTLPLFNLFTAFTTSSHPFCVQPMGLHHPCILNICIAGPCPINFSTCLLLLQVVLRSLSRGPYLLPRKFFKLFTTFANGTQIIVSRAISFLLFAYLFCSHAMRL